MELSRTVSETRIVQITLRLEEHLLIKANGGKANP